MPTIKDEAKTYESKQTKNIAELKEVTLDTAIFEEKAKDSNGVDFIYNYIEVDKERYRVPNKILSDLKAILEKKPTLTKFSVTKSGTGLNTKYTVIPLD